MLLPTEHKTITVLPADNEVTVTHGQKRWVFPREDCVLLPLANTTAELLARQLEIAAEYEEVRGTFPFLYNDYRDPSKPINHYWRGTNLKGVVSYARHHKVGWERLRGIYSGE